MFSHSDYQTGPYRCLVLNSSSKRFIYPDLHAIWTSTTLKGAAYTVIIIMKSNEKKKNNIKK